MIVARDLKNKEVTHTGNAPPINQYSHTPDIGNRMLIILTKKIPPPLKTEGTKIYVRFLFTAKF